jgi:alpha-L-fucosidase
MLIENGVKERVFPTGNSNSGRSDAGLYSRRAAAEQKVTQRATPRRGLPLLDLQQRFVDLRFGMFVHFNMATFQDREWGDPTSLADLFRPTALDTDQWAAAAQSANMTWGCLTTRHHDGFCLWPTKTAAASVGQTLYSTDVVRAYVNSFPKAGLRVRLYYSILSPRDDISHFNVTPSKIQLIKDQLAELFTGYGEDPNLHRAQRWLFQSVYGRKANQSK